MVNDAPNEAPFRWILLPCALVLCLVAWLRGAEYDEQYTLFLTSGMARPDWPSGVFPAGLAREIQSGHATLAAIGRDLRLTDVHPPLYFWLISPWRAIFGDGLFVARLFSVAAGLGALGLTGIIARSARLPAIPAMLLTLGCYGFAYTSAIARGFALAQVLLLGGVASLFLGRRLWHFGLAGVLLGAATFSNYLAAFTAGACLLAFSIGTRRARLVAAVLGLLPFIAADLWWFLAQRGSRDGQFPSFSLPESLPRLAARAAGAIFGALPLYVDGVASWLLAAALSLFLLTLAGRVIWSWRRIGVLHARIMFAMGAAAAPLGLLALGAIFDTTPIEVRYLAFSTPFVGLLLAGALGPRMTASVLAVQAVALAGLMLAPQTMQPARAAAHAAAALVGDGVVLLPKGNDGVGIVGAFAIESPPGLRLLLIRPEDTRDEIRARIGAYHRVVLAMLEQDRAGVAASSAMRDALLAPDWREVARTPNVAVYERVGDGE